MATKADKKKKKDIPIGLHAEVIKQPITETLEKNFMPYAMSVILARALPEIDGFKTSHRKLLYMMYKMGLLTGGRTKSANIVGQTMKLNPHGDQSIYETMVRLTRGNDSLLTPFIDSKGNFGKVYYKDDTYAAARYTEAKLDEVCTELFRDIDHETVDFVYNYDNTMKEPTLLPTTFPNVLASANLGIAVGMASNICGFNLAEVCRTTIAYLRNSECDLFDTLPAPDFTTGGEIVYDKAEFENIYRTGRGSFKVRARWRYIKEENIIEVYEIPYTAKLESILENVTKLVKDGKIKEIADMRNETDLSGLKLAIDLRRGVDPDKLMQKLFKMTTLCDSFKCNFNILVAGTPRVLGVREIISEWCAWRIECVKRRLSYDVQALKSKLHLLRGLQKILLDIDKAIKIIRETDEEADVIPNLMIGFRIDELQADYIADIRLRQINKEYILKRTNEINKLEDEVKELEIILADKLKISALIIKELETVIKKYSSPRRSMLVYDHAEYQPEEHIEDYAVHVFITKEGYLKKITAQSLRMSSEHKFKDGDALSQNFEASNKEEILVFTDKQQCYKVRLHEFEDSKASVLGEYLPSKLSMDDGESVVYVCRPLDYSGSMLFCFENGKVARVELSAYATVSNRKRLTGAYSDKSPLCAIRTLLTEHELALRTSDSRVLVFHTAALTPKSTRNTIGVVVIAVKPRHKVIAMLEPEKLGFADVSKYRARALPGPGTLIKPEDRGETQLSL